MSEHLDKLMPYFIGILKSLGIDKQTSTGICCMLETEADMNRIVDLLCESKDNITAEEAEQICLRVIAGKE